MAWWIWIVLGLSLAALEMFLGAELWLVLAGAAALIVGLLAALGIEGQGTQGLVFAVLLASVFLIRRRLRLRPKAAEVASESLVGELGTAISAIAPGSPGSARFRGTRWPAHAAGSRSIGPGASVRVVRMEGITLFVDAE